MADPRISGAHAPTPKHPKCMKNCRFPSVERTLNNSYKNKKLFSIAQQGIGKRNPSKFGDEETFLRVCPAASNSAFLEMSMTIHGQ